MQLVMAKEVLALTALYSGRFDEALKLVKDLEIEVRVKLDANEQVMAKIRYHLQRVIEKIH